jgi:predicted nucleic acid-binding protein
MIIVDANLVVATAVPMLFTNRATQLLNRWKNDQVSLSAPTLFEYEVVTALRKSMVLKMISRPEALYALETILALGIDLVVPDRSLDEEALTFAERIGQSKAYDGHYLALAARENAPFWTADSRLAAAAQQTGLRWVHWVGEEAARP